MIVSELRLYNFRKFKSNDGKPGLIINFHAGLNAIIGENDSGKTAIIDAIKLVLHTQSNEFIRPTDDDFYMDEDGTSANEFRIHCTISDFEPNEAKNFIEYLNYEKDENGGIHYFLFLYFHAWKDGKNGSRIFSELKIGDEDDGISIDGKARELLKAVYLKPLRDAEREMSAGRGSRISQILMSHPLFKTGSSDSGGKTGNEHELIRIFKEANSSIEAYFTDDAGQLILKTIKNHLSAFNERRDGNTHDAQLKASDVRLRAILESLSLNVSETHPGLGELNLLFIAAELLLLYEDLEGGLRLALIEELEAHLHPQAQLRLIKFLQNEYTEHGSQIIISTHSPILASKINLKNLILLKNNEGYDLSEGKTGLRKGDYLFLQRFLDATKSNFFFAKGIIMVEGDAENLLIPMIAEIIGYPLENYGISIVNVGSTAFLRYSHIFVRSTAGKTEGSTDEHACMDEQKEAKTIGIPISIVTDCDVRPESVDDQSSDKVRINKTKIRGAIENKHKRYDVGSIKSFISPCWTLEYCIAKSFLYEDMYKAILYAKKIKNSEDISLTEDKIREANAMADKDLEAWANYSCSARAYKIFGSMLDNGSSSKLKAIAAQCLSSMLKWKISEVPKGLTQENMFDSELYQFSVDEVKRRALAEKIMSDEYLGYIVDAIKYAVGVE